MAMTRAGKGDKDRATPLPAVARAGLVAQLEAVQRQHDADLRLGAGWVELPWALARKYPNAGREWPWQWVFPATRIYVDRETGQRRRHHLQESVLQRAVKEAVRRAGIPKRATCHTLRHSFATHLFEDEERGGMKTMIAAVSGNVVRFPIRFDRWYGVLSSLLGLPPSTAYVKLDGTPRNPMSRAEVIEKARADARRRRRRSR